MSMAPNDTKTPLPSATAGTSYPSITRRLFAMMILNSLGIKVNSENVKALVAWQLAESGTNNDSPGSTYSWNPLKTTKTAPGATSQNSHGVKKYPNFLTGLQATVDTLRLGHYTGIVAALKTGSAMDIANAVANSPWGTGGGVRNVLNTGVSQSAYSHVIGNATEKASVVDRILTGPLGDAGEAIAGAINAVPGMELLGKLAQGKTWVAIAYVVGGMVIGVLGILIIVKPSNLPIPGPAGAVVKAVT